MRSRWITASIATLLLIQAALLTYSARVHSPTWDEVGHLAAGISHWELGRFELYSVNPPLVRTLAAAPVVAFCEPKMDWDFYRSDPRLRSEVYLGRRMIELNGERSFDHMFIARLAVIPIALLGSWLCFLWGRDLFGPTSGLIAMAIWTFSPNVLAYGSVITPDLPSAVALLGASYVFWQWLLQPNWLNALTLAMATAMAMLTKSIWIMMPVMYTLIWAVSQLKTMQQSSENTSKRMSALQLVAASGLALLLVNGFYGFTGSMQSLGQYTFASDTFTGHETDRNLNGKESTPSVSLVSTSTPAVPSPDGTANAFAPTPSPKAASDCPDCEEPRATPSGYGNRFTGTLLGSIPIPVPANYLEGIDVQARDFEHGRFDPGWQSYLFGKWQQGGWWYYYIVGLFYKETLATWILVAMGSIAALVWRPQREFLLGVACLWVPALVLFVVVSSATGLNRYVRYAIPVLPVLFIWASQIGRYFDQPELMNQRSRRLLASGASLAGVWLLASTLWYSPHYLSYFNEAAGGPEHGHEILCDSNIDWGQDLLELRAWLKEHPEAASSLRLAYFGSFDPVAVGIKYQLPPPKNSSRFDASVRPSNMKGGWYVISKNYLAGHSMPIPDGLGQIQFKFFGEPVFEYFSQCEPVDQIGQSMLVYHLTTEELAKAHEQLTLVADWSVSQ